MQVYDLIWLDEIEDKLHWKHNVTSQEVEFVIRNKPHFRFISKGRRNRTENVYSAYGQTDGGRFLVVFSSTRLIVVR